MLPRPTSGRDETGSREVQATITGVTGTDQSRLELVIFDVARARCALPLDAVGEILHMAALARSPGLPPILPGFLNLDGACVPVIDAARLFELPAEAPGLYTPLVVLRQAPFALQVDAVLGTHFGDSADLVPVDEAKIFNRCVTAQVETAHGPAHLLAVDRILLEEERQRVEALAERHRKRVQALASEDDDA